MSNQLQTVGIIGNGVVGGATARVMMSVAKVMIYDIDPTKSVDGIDTMVEEKATIILCLPDLDSIHTTCSLLAEHHKYQGLVVLRSTVPVGTTKALRDNLGLNIIHWPEFLTERLAYWEAHLPYRNIIGVPNGWYGDHEEFRLMLESRFPGVPSWVTTSDESEAIKLIQNAFFAVKVAFFNEMRTFCDHESMSWRRIIGGLLLDPRIGSTHTNVPGPDGQRGFGGKCLPKDLLCLIRQMTEEMLNPTVCYAAHIRNTLLDRQTTEDDVATKPKNKEEGGMI